MRQKNQFYRLLLTSIFFTFYLNTSLAQSEDGVTLTPSEYHHELLTNLHGVYQVQLDNPRLKLAISTDMLELIKNNQLDSTTNSIEYKSMRIIIKSKSDVDNGLLFDESEFVVKK